MADYFGPSTEGGYAAGTGYTSAVNLPPHSHSHSLTATPNIGAQASVPSRWGEQHLHTMLASRMNWGYGVKCTFQRIVPWMVTPETVVVFVVLKDSAIIIEDDAHLYPSDALVTQLRILAEAT